MSSSPGGRGGFPPAIYLFFGLVALFLFGASLLSSTRIALFGRDVEGRVVDVSFARRLASVTIEYRAEDGRLVRSSRGRFNHTQLAALMTETGRYEKGSPFVPTDLVGAVVPVRYAVGAPEIAHIRRWDPLYRELVISHLAWMVCAGLATVTWRLRSK